MHAALVLLHLALARSWPGCVLAEVLFERARLGLALGAGVYGRLA